MRIRLAISLAAALVLAAPLSAKQPKEVTIVDSVPVPVDVNTPIDLAPGQIIEAEERVFAPGELVVLQSFLATSSAQIKQLSIPVDIVMQTVTVVPAAIDSNEGLVNCSATLRWPSDPNPLDPASTDRIIVDHRWPGANQVSMNYAMPYKVFLEAGSKLETSVGRVGASGFCSALIQVTGTRVP